jgi:XTP/dITP diphosphohydrolase
VTRPLLVLATRNRGKLHELAPMSEAAGFQAISLEDAAIAEDAAVEDRLEAFDTFEENALAKARYFFTLAGGAAVMADDSGLAVDALNGEPGVHSKRWSGSRAAGAALDAENNAKLMEALRGKTNRRARFACVAALVSAGRERSARGEHEGRILETPSGTFGFGYDPYFWSDALGKTFADATREEKARVSHRARAVDLVLACG